MNLAAKFRMTSSCQTFRISSLTVDKPYPKKRAEKIQTRYGEAVLLTLKESPQAFVKVFLPKRYGAVFTDDDIKSINEKSVSLTFRYRGTCPTSNSDILEIE
jgi:hypothetical protein